ncbi:MAG: hypothetical protein ACR2OU_14775 [Thermomicrobiales bacterium]
MGGTIANAAGLQISNLRTEYLEDPLGVDSARPRLSWELTSTKRGAAQRRYQIIVATDPELLERGEGDLWDSGQNESAETA